MARACGVCFVFDDFHPVFSGHAVYMQQVMERFPRSWRLTVVARNPGGLPARSSLGRITIVRVPHDPSPLRYSLRVARTLVALRAHHHCVHLNGFLDRYGIILATLTLLRRRLVLQVTLMGSDDARSFLRSHKLGRFRLLLLSGVHALIGISEPLLDSYRACGFPAAKLVLIPQGVDTHYFSPTDPSLRAKRRSAIDVGEDERVVVFVGTVMRRKGVDTLLQAWTAVQSRVPRARLILVGMDDFDATHAHREELMAFVEEQRRFIRSNRLRVGFTGLVPDVRPWLQAADVFVLPSRKEGFGNVILEAMACALPCVVTPMDGVAFESVAPGETGYVVADATEITDALVRLLESPSLAEAMGRRGRQRTLADFDLDAIAARYAAIYAVCTA